MSHSNDSTAAKRIREVLDQDSFVELGTYVTARSTDFNLTGEQTPADGVVTGYGTIEDKLVFIYSQDPDVMGGSVGEMHAAKIAHLYEQAMKMGAPIIGLIDCSGFRIQEAVDALNAFGTLYRCQALASGVIPQIQAVYGTCGGSLAVSAAMADFTFIEKENGKLFMHVPTAVDGKADDTDTSSPEFQCSETGTAAFSGTSEEIAEEIRKLVDILPANNSVDLSEGECKDSLNRLVPGIDDLDARAQLEKISDDGFVMEPWKDFGPNVVTAFIRLNGRTVGVIANAADEACSRGLKKAVRFVNFCDAFEIPLLTLVNAAGFTKTMSTELESAAEAAKLISAYASATVPKVTVITGKARGLAYNVFGPKTVSDLVLAWPSAEVSIMDAGDAVRIMYADELEKTENKKDLYDEKTAEYAALQASATGAAKRGYVDDIIDPQLTRKRAAAAFEMLYSKDEDIPAKKHGTV